MISSTISAKRLRDLRLVRIVLLLYNGHEPSGIKARIVLLKHASEVFSEREAAILPVRACADHMRANVLGYGDVVTLREQRRFSVVNAVQVFVHCTGSHVLFPSDRMR